MQTGEFGGKGGGGGVWLGDSYGRASELIQDQIHLGQGGSSSDVLFHFSAVVFLLEWLQA